MSFPFRRGTVVVVIFILATADRWQLPAPRLPPDSPEAP
jgi:hypothetical protein